MTIAVCVLLCRVDSYQHAVEPPNNVPRTHSPYAEKGRSSPPAEPPPPPPSQPNVLEIILKRNKQGYGFSIRGGQEYRNSPLYVLRVAAGGAAAVDGRLQVSISTSTMICSSMSSSGVSCFFSSGESYISGACLFTSVNPVYFMF